MHLHLPHVHNTSKARESEKVLTYQTIYDIMRKFAKLL